MNCLKHLHLSGNLFIRKLITRTGIVITLLGVLAIAADSEHFTGEIVLGNGKFYSYVGQIVQKPLIKPHYFYFGIDAPHRLYLYRGTIQPTMPNGDAMWGTITLRYTAPENP